MDKAFLEKIQKQSPKGRLSLIDRLGIFELRGLARELGVSSPTTRKRDQLVSLILERLNSGERIEDQGTRKGRPVKTLNNLDEIMSAMSKVNDGPSFGSVKRLKSYDEVISFAQEMPLINLIQEDEIREFEGVFRLGDRLGYFLDIKDRTKVFIPADIIKKYALQTGDYLHAVANKLNNSNQFIASQLKQINFDSAAHYKRPSSAAKTQIISFDTLPYGDFKLFKGRRNLVRYDHNIYEDSRFMDFAKNLLSQDYHIVVVGLNTSFEDSIMIGSVPQIVNLTTRYADDIQQGLDKVVDAISLATRLGQVGKKVVLFVNDIVEILSTLDLCFEEKEKIMGHLPEAIVIGQKLISTASICSDGSEVTLVMTYRNYDADDKFLVNEVFRVANIFA